MIEKSSLLLQLRFEEGVRLHAYMDTTGNKTIGIGRNLKANPYFNSELVPDIITEEIAEAMCLSDINDIKKSLMSKLDFFESLDEVRQDALTQMAFQLGIAGFMAFKDTIYCLRLELWGLAHDHAMDSEWARTFTDRARRVTSQLLNGERYKVPESSTVF